jgi:hypothetical protein
VSSGGKRSLLVPVVHPKGNEQWFALLRIAEADDELTQLIDTRCYSRIGIVILPGATAS